MDREEIRQMIDEIGDVVKKHGINRKNDCVAIFSSIHVDDNPTQSMEDICMIGNSEYMFAPLYAAMGSLKKEDVDPQGLTLIFGMSVALKRAALNHPAAIYAIESMVCDLRNKGVTLNFDQKPNER